MERKNVREIERNEEQLIAEKTRINAGLSELRRRGVRVLGMTVSLHAGRDMLPWAERQGWDHHERHRTVGTTIRGVPTGGYLVDQVVFAAHGLPPVRQGWVYECIGGIDFRVSTAEPAPRCDEHRRDDVRPEPVTADEQRGPAMPGELTDAIELALQDGGEVVGALVEGGQHEWLAELGWQRAGVRDSRMVGRSETDEERETHTRRWETWAGQQVLVSRPRVQHASATPVVSNGTLTLRGYQVRTIAAAQEAWESGMTRVLIQSVTGSGKSVMIGKIARDWADQGGTVICLAHTRELIFQLRDHLIRGGLAPEDVGMLMGGYAPEPGQRIVVSTIQSAKKLEVEPGRLLLIIDEAHHAGSSSYVAQVGALQPARVLGVTATPARKSGKPLSDVFETMITALEYRDGFSGLDGDAPYLVEPRYYVPSAHDLEALRQMQQQITAAPMVGGEISGEAVEAIIRANPQIVGDIVEHIGKLADDRQGIVFAATVAHAQAIAEAIAADGRTAAMICGETPKVERDEIMAAFRDGEISWLSNVGVLIEGVDVPDVGAVFNARPTKNATFWCQAIGRGLRRPVAEDPAEQKLDCVFADFTGSFLVMGPVDAYDNAYWRELWTEGKQGVAKKAKERKVSLATTDRTCRCGCKWQGGPACPACGAIGNSRQFDAENAEALRAELQEVRTPDDMRALISTLRGRAQVDDLMLVMNSGLSLEQRQAALKKIMTAEQQQDCWYQLRQFALSRGKREGWAYYLYKDLLGTGPSNAWGKRERPVTPEFGRLFSELLRKRAAHARLSGRSGNWGQQPPRM